MTTLLESAIKARGGWERWRNASRLTAHASVGGGTLALKGWPGVLDDARFTIDPHRQLTRIRPFGNPDQSAVFEPGRTMIVDLNDKPLQVREHPRQAFAGHGLATPWDALHLAYFAGYAMWTYLTTPFLLTMQGVEVDELAPWHEGGETWRRLQVRFPDTIASHSPVQTLYFGSDGLLRRHDYSVDVIGGTSSANYASEHRNFGGLVFPTKRRVFRIGPDNFPLKDRVILSVDFHAIDVDWSVSSHE
ncbi:MAG: hypothetical protein JO006_12705 [Paucibacter sp.]|nr:hypothetical protein [Roseateles sp.]